MRRLLLTILLCLFSFPLAGCDEEMLRALQAYQRGEISQAEFEAAVRAYAQRNIYASSTDETPTEPDSPAVDRFGCEELLETSPRGLACLHCNHENARYQADVISNTMMQSCVKNLAVNYMLDGTFGYDEAFMREQLTKLSSAGRKLYANFYLLNGSSQRRYKTTPVTALGTKMAPEEFRARIVYDPEFRQAVSAHIQQFAPLFRFAASRGISISVVPMLEDNLTDESFNALLDVTLQSLPPEVSFAIGRNPCPGCYDGNEATVPAPLFTELHTNTADFALTNALISNDGFEIQSPAEMAPLRDLAAVQGNIFILWDGARQGLWGEDSVHTSPDERFYVVPSAADRRALRTFLRQNP